MASPTAGIPSPPTKQAAVVPDMRARDALMVWYRGEFAAANAIIDALCHHITQIAPPDQRHDYEAVFAAIHHRRINWVPLLHLQKYFSIAEVALGLQRAATAAASKKSKTELLTVVVKDIASPEGVMAEEDDKYKDKETVGVQEVEKDGVAGSIVEREVSKNRQINHEEERIEDVSARIKITKGFVAKEAVKGHMVNVVKGLKMYEDVFTESEIEQLNGYVNELRFAGRRGELSGETFILFNQQMKGNKREIIQLGTPIFQPETTGSIEPIPVALHEVIDKLIRCRLLPETRKPNSCMINFFDEGEFSQPYMKPPHVEQPISTLVLSESTMAFGRILVMDHDGNFKGPLTLPLQQGSLLVMRGNSADMARHVMCPSSNKRITLTFVKVRSLPAAQDALQPPNTPPLTRTLALWQPGRPHPYKLPSEAFGYKAESALMPKWGYTRASSVVMLAPAPLAAPIIVPAKAIVHSGGGTGVFLPWSMGSRKPAKHVPPRIQRVRLLPPTSSTTNSESGKSSSGDSDATV